MSDSKTALKLTDTIDYYDILQLKPTARLIEIKKAFRQLQRIAHPDQSRNSETTEEQLQTNRETASKLNKAYEILSNPLLRLQYDLQNGFLLESTANLAKLQQYKRKKAMKEKENMLQLYKKSIDIESKVNIELENGDQLFNAGLLITKARYGLIDIYYEQQKHKQQILFPFKSDTNLIINENARNVSNIDSNINIIDSSSNTNEMISNAITTQIKSEPKKKSETEISAEQYIIDVTHAVQCLVSHRGIKGGFLQIDDKLDKETLIGFYDPCPFSNEYSSAKKYLEIEYEFQCKHHYCKIEQFEYFLIPSEKHIVHLFENIETEEEIDAKMEEEKKLEKKLKNINNDSNKNRKKTYDSNLFPFNSPMNNKNTALMRFSLRPNIVQKSKQERVIIQLPSGKRAYLSRPSLSGMQKFIIEESKEDIERERGKKKRHTDGKSSMIHNLRMGNYENEEKGNGESDGNGKNSFVISMMVLGIIGSVGCCYYYYRYIYGQSTKDSQKE